MRSSDAVDGGIEPPAAQTFERARLSHAHQVSALRSALVYRASQNVIRGEPLKVKDAVRRRNYRVLCCVSNTRCGTFVSIVCDLSMPHADETSSAETSCSGACSLVQHCVGPNLFCVPGPFTTQASRLRSKGGYFPRGSRRRSRSRVASIEKTSTARYPTKCPTPTSPRRPKAQLVRLVLCV